MQAGDLIALMASVIMAPEFNQDVEHSVDLAERIFKDVLSRGYTAGGQTKIYPPVESK